MSNTPTPPTLAGPAGSALVRQCDGCGMTTAADLDATPEHATEMQMAGQTVREVSVDECLRLWKNAGKCQCIPVWGPYRRHADGWYRLESPNAERSGGES